MYYTDANLHKINESRVDFEKKMNHLASNFHKKTEGCVPRSALRRKAVAIQAWSRRDSSVKPTRFKREADAPKEAWILK